MSTQIRPESSYSGNYGPC